VITIKDIDAKYRAVIVFGISAFIFSFLTGLFSGISFGVVIFRSFTALILFAGLGYGLILVLKQFVPEVTEIGIAIKKADAEDLEIDEESSSSGGESETAEVDEAGSAAEHTAKGEGFTEFTGDEFPRAADPSLNDSLDSGATAGNGAVNASQGKMGKHIIADNGQFKYEPKLMAEAVRTMMSKDEE
jgi:hypothetical protein